MRPSPPPRWLEALVRWALPSGLSGDGAVGDLREAFDRKAQRSRVRALVWYSGQAASIVAYRAVRRPSDLTGGGSDVGMDLRWSARSIARRPAFTAAVVGILGLGLGANVAVFSVVDGTLANTSWWADSDRATAVWPDDRFSLGQLEMYAEQQDAYRSLGGYVELAFAVELPDGTSRSVSGVLMTSTLFSELAVQPVLGRGLVPDDGAFGAEPVVVLGDGVWRESFGADPDILGRRVTIGGRPATVVGIQGPSGRAPGGRTQLWAPIVPDPRDDDYWKASSYTVIGVRRDDADLGRAHDDLMAFTHTLSSLFPMFYPEGYAEGRAHVTRADEAQRRIVGTPLLLLLGGTAMLMLVTALNVGSMLLGRSLDRRGELAVRVSLGASRGRLVRQLLVEGFVLTGLALGVGLVAGALGSDWVTRLFVESPVVARSDVLSANVLAFAGVAAAGAWVLLNGVPVAHFLRQGRRGSAIARGRSSRAQRSLVTLQAALATLLIVSSALLVATVDNLRRVPLGFDPQDIVTVELSTPQDRVSSPTVARELYGRLLERVEAIPSVSAAGMTGWLPLRQDAPPTPINLRSAPVDPREAIRAPMHMVDPGFFATLGVDASEGRVLGSEEQSLDAPSAIVVNETLARMLWPNGSAVGQMIAIDPHAWDSWAPVVGVVPDVRSGAIDGPIGPALYVALAESPSRDVTLVLRASDDVPTLEGAVRRAIDDVDPLIPVRTVSGMEDVVRGAYSTAWVMMGLLTLLATLATGLGAVGIYAILAQHVARNRREIGVRLALGAEPTSVVLRVVHSGLTLALIGIGVGLLGALWSTRFLESLLVGVSALAPSAFVAPVLLLSAAAVVAAWIPAARAGRTPPAEVLKSE
ncbi:MAG: ABC transporter permease [Gemmatimonadota bacterium]